MQLLLQSQNNVVLIEISSCRRRGLIGNRSDWVSSRNPLVVDEFVLCIHSSFLEWISVLSREKCDLQLRKRGGFSFRAKNK